jgi:hypothetical protein
MSGSFLTGPPAKGNKAAKREIEGDFDCALQKGLRNLNYIKGLMMPFFL